MTATSPVGQEIVNYITGKGGSCRVSAVSSIPAVDELMLSRKELLELLRELGLWVDEFGNDVHLEEPAKLDSDPREPQPHGQQADSLSGQKPATSEQSETGPSYREGASRVRARRQPAKKTRGLNPGSAHPSRGGVTPKEQKPKSARGATTSPKSQNAHIHAMRKDLKYDTFGIGAMMHLFCYLPSNKGKAVMSMERIAAEAGCSEATARRHMRILVERGWFTRIDDGKGKASGKTGNMATYQPSMPEWHQDAKGVN